MNQFYFKINLNKQGELKQQEAETKRQLKFVILGAVAVLLLGMSFFVYIQKMLDDRLQSRKTTLSKIKKELKNLEASGDYLTKNDIQKLAAYSNDRIFWTKKLEALSEKTSDKIAITSFAFKGKTLILNGITKIDKEEKELDHINEFINKLKSDPRISEDFPNIGIESAKRSKAEDVSIIQFKIGCTKIGKRG